ncbi:unnamed protein product [Calicophoron daubneyi]|uniref:Tyrosine-protein kinase n=1 Tax=Calicophoron daubneyi TaxID=300641 RepID=A0AAV2TAV4_CALDB
MGNSTSTGNEQCNWIAVSTGDNFDTNSGRPHADRRQLNSYKMPTTPSSGALNSFPAMMDLQSRVRAHSMANSHQAKEPLPINKHMSQGLSNEVCGYPHNPSKNSNNNNNCVPSITSAQQQFAPMLQHSQTFQNCIVSSNNLNNNPTNAITVVAASAPVQLDVNFVALHDYVKRVDDDLGMTKGQIFRILDQSHSDWWYAECILTGQRGYVPKNHLAAVTSLESNEWYFGELRRIEAEHYLQLPGNVHGSFLVRISESQSSEFSLSVREEDTIKHYRIRSRCSRTNPELKRYYISRQLPFVTIEQLVNHYMENQSGLCCCLTRPCIRPTHPEPVGLSHKLIDKWEIPKSSIVLKEKIGQGQFGEVYKAVWNKTTIVAVKTLKPSSCDAADFLREAQTMKRLHHPNLIQLYAVCTQSEPFYLVTEFMSKGSLLNHLQSPEGRNLSLQCLVMMAAKIASGMAYLESRRHIHRDLAARNVLVGEQHVVKIADFGLARMIHNREYVAHAGARFPIKWTAPEAANYSRFTIKSDVWSFGILLTEIVTYGRLPYPGMHNAEVLRQVEAGYRMSKPPGCPPELYDLMLDCWAADENKRPSFAEIHARLEEYCEEEPPAYRNMGGGANNSLTSAQPSRTPSSSTSAVPNVHSGTVTNPNPKDFHNSIQIPVSP